ncbi:ABC transporter ATP-binding protein [Devosia faecipullorum]|uniref:ABC transporter ATP-binding protein n=1 Tax=Devosia faecipullorum TaxID=2755039 RepID=UPI00187B86A9|nr:ABC transporter ATP-binding protein [Devosia faecipullorum]MBE7734528.1 ABC transporter ATP-binding protein [Devosia faecipullorum]
MNAVAAFWLRLPQRRRRQFYGLIGLSLIASVAEVTSLAMLFPLLLLLSSPHKAMDSDLLRSVATVLGITETEHLVLAALFTFVAAALAAGSIRWIVMAFNNNYSFGLAAELSERTYRKSLLQPYSVQLQRNSSTIIDGVMNKTMAVASNVIAQILTLMTSVVVGMSILVTLLITDPTVAAITGITFATIYTSITIAVRSRLRNNAETIARESGRAIRALQEGLGSIRDVLIDGSQETFTHIFRSSDRSLKTAMSRNAIIAGSPRFIVETLGMILIATLAFFLTRADGGMGSAIPTLGVLALGAQRLLPMLQQSYAAIATIRGNETSIWNVIELLDQPDGPAQSITSVLFDKEIRLSAVGFQYPTASAAVLHNMTLTIPKGCRYGFYGPTGGGKSTTLDIIMGLLEPSSGQIQVDGLSITGQHHKAWRAHIAHVPQAIYLSDSTIAENIAFSSKRDEIDMDRLRAAARSAQIADTIESWPDGYDTLVGERGLRISGGQRQRIGVARALYKQADLIILDEATSALDNQTESALIEAIEALGSDITVIMVAHRLTTLKNCDTLVEIEGGRVKRMGRYEDVFTTDG